MSQTKNPVPTKQKPNAQHIPLQTKADREKEKEKRKERGNEGESSTRTTRSGDRTGSDECQRR
jgi:hypothetical protein